MRTFSDATNVAGGAGRCARAAKASGSVPVHDGQPGVTRPAWAVLALLLATFITPLSTARAQSYSVDWFKVAGGGGTSTGGVFAVSGTVGQPDAGRLSGGNFSIEGGFWGIITAVQTPGAPLLSVEQVGNAVRIYWLRPATGFVLDQSLTVTGAWSQVAFPYTTNATQISITVPAPAGNKFYRLRQP